MNSPFHRLNLLRISKEGTSDGARRGWESRKGGGAGVPKNAKKLTINQASGVLQAKGYKLGDSTGYTPGQPTAYNVTGPDGQTNVMTTDQIKQMVYS